MRYNSTDIIEVGSVTSGTSAQFVGFNTKTGKKGIYKENGCILGMDDDDVREKIASELLTSAGIETASIDLVYDENTGNPAYFSNYIIEDNEELVTPDIYGCESSEPNPIDNICDRYIQGVRKLTSDEKFVEESRKNFYKYTYVCCLMDSYDIKPDNLPVGRNKETGELFISPYFDFGTAFHEEHKSSTLYDMSGDEIMESLFQNGSSYISDIVNEVNSKLTPDKIEEIFASDYVVERFDSQTIETMKTRVLSQIEKSKELQMSKEEINVEKTTGIKGFINNIKNKFTALIGKIKGTKMLGEPADLEYEDKEKLAALGYSSVAEMNADDPEAELYKSLTEGTNLPEEVAEYDLTNEGQDTLTVETRKVEDR